ncbi:cleavage and polyadenylation specificity factor subunit, partial [Trifolium medium]|nr:cleavage and polyadenylation specificity factor subunit [Trifolium medium]
YSGAFSVIQHRLKQIYESVEASVDEESGVPTLVVHDRVTVKHESDKHISLHWTSDPISDMTEKVMHALLNSLFGNVKVGENGKLIINVDGNVAELNKESGEVESENEGLKERVRTAFRRIQSSVKPIPLSAP